MRCFSLFAGRYPSKIDTSFSNLNGLAQRRNAFGGEGFQRAARESGVT